jgi:adenine-specific DNA-methyltransferase
MNTELKRIHFLLETEAEISLARDTKDNIETAQDLPRYITNYIGSKQKLVDWIWVHTPDGVTSVLDAFSGSAVVGYMYKAKGLDVVANDRLHYCYHIARAIIENSSVMVSEEELDALLKSNSKAGDFVQETFRGKFFQSGVHQIIDNIRANIDDLQGYKKDIALFALAKSCISGSGSYGHFASTSKGSGNRHADTPKAFTDRFRGNIVRINSLVFDNGKENKVFCKDIQEVIPEAKVDLAYFDPPYATEYSTTNYETSYHFIEGLMTYWKGLEIDETSRVKKFHTDHKSVSQSNSEEFFDGFLNKSKGIKHWIISYRDHAYPNESKMKKLIDKHGKESRMFSREHSYSMAGQNRSGEASHGKEHIFVCSEPSKTKTTKAVIRECHTSLTGDIVLPDGMSSEAATETPTGEQKFTFILTHAGTNLNGDHFTVAELRSNHESAINTKIDLKHSQDLTDIVGGVTEARFRETEGGLVECDGELYTEDNPFSRLAYKLISKGIVKQVSMECDYEEGECSFCGKRIKSKKNYCLHMKKYKGREYQGKQVFEILHNITFTGMGLLDRKGADPGAKILSVAKNTLSIEDNNMETIADFQSYLTAKKINEEVWPLTSAFEGYVRQLLKKFGSDDINSDDLNSLITSGLEIFSTKVKGLVDVAKSTAANNASAGVEEDLKKVQQENETLKKQVEDLQKQIETFETEKRNAERKSRASKLIETWEQRGRKFKDEADRTTEIERLAGLDDSAFDAAKSVIDALPENKAEGTQRREKVMRSDAGIEPMAVDDKASDLAVRLGKGLREARDAKVE